MKENMVGQCPQEGPQDSTSNVAEQDKLVTLRSSTLDLLIAHLVELPFEKVHPLLDYLQQDLDTFAEPEPSIIVK